jgi:hypothetical protein
MALLKLADKYTPKLHEMKLSVMAKTLRTQMGDIRCNDMAFEERLGLIVDAK